MTAPAQVRAGARAAEPAVSPVPAQGQLIPVTPGRYDWIRLWFDPRPAPGEQWPAETIWLHYADAVDPEWLHWPPGSGPCRLPVPRHTDLVGFRLPARPGLRLLRFRLVPAGSAQVDGGHG